MTDDSSLYSYCMYGLANSKSPNNQPQRKINILFFTGTTFLILFPQHHPKMERFEADELPDIDAPIVPQPPPDHLLEDNGAARDIDEYLEECFWNISSVSNKTAVRVVVDGQEVFTYRFDVDWEPTWHSTPMIRQLQSRGWRPEHVSGSRRNEQHGYTERMCIWPRGQELFINLSPHYQRLVVREYGYVFVLCWSTPSFQYCSVLLTSPSYIQ
jgi:hypothetical protein